MKTFLLSIFLVGFTTMYAQRTITGTVSDDEGPLPGVNVLVKGTKIGTETDFDGKYAIQAKTGDILVFTFVGMQVVEKVVGSADVINVKMMSDNAVLDEVVITALGIKREKKSLGYATKKDKTSYTPGVKISQSNENIIIRGYSSIAYNPIVNEESYRGITENAFKSPLKDPLSTFSIDVDKASYANLRRMLNNGEKVPEDAVKIEEMVNYFHYDYAQPTDEHPFAIYTEAATCPWEEKHQLVRIALQGKTIPTENLPASNLVFLIDVSGSMDSPQKLPLLKSAFKLLVNQLRKKDKVSIVVYAGAAGTVLEPTSGDKKEKIMEALDRLEAGGSTAGAEGIQLAYKLAEKNFIKNGNNRVILATDGDFNVGISSDGELQKLIEEKRKTGVYLTALGFGMGNYKDSKLETLADKGNGNHAYIDTMQEAQKVLGEEFGGTLFTIAKDVKIQVEFNPEKVQAYRLIGYENRLLNDEDFTDDAIDAGEIGSGHTVTAFYEIIPQGVKSEFTKKLPTLKYTEHTANDAYTQELLTVKFRYKKPNEDSSIEMVKVVPDAVKNLSQTDDDFRFAAAVILFGMKLKNSEFAGKSDYEKVIKLATDAKGNDEQGYRSEFVRLVKAVK